MKMHKILIGLIVIVTMVFGTTSCGGNSQIDINKETEEAAKMVLEMVPYPAFGSIGGEWAVKGVIDSGLEDEQVSQFKEAYLDDIKAQTKLKKGVLDNKFYTTYGRVAIVLAAAGEDPKGFQGYNLVEKLDESEKIMEQGVVGCSYALIGAKVAGFKLKNEKTYVEYLVNEINEQKLYDIEAWVDMISMALEALSFYGDYDGADETIKKSIDGLSNFQKNDGSYGNCESTAEVIIALTMNEIDPQTDQRFIKSGKSLVDGLLCYKDKGKYLHLKNEANKGNCQMSTEKALLALVSVKKMSEGSGLYA